MRIYALLIAVLFSLLQGGCTQRSQPPDVPEPQFSAFATNISQLIDFSVVDTRLRLLHEIGGTQAIGNTVERYPDLVLPIFVRAVGIEGIRSAYVLALAESWQQRRQENTLQSAIAHIRSNPSFMHLVRELVAAEQAISDGDLTAARLWYQERNEYFSAHPFWQSAVLILGRKLGYIDATQIPEQASTVQQIWLSASTDHPQVVRDAQGRILLSLSTLNALEDVIDPSMGIGVLSRDSYRELADMAISIQQPLLALAFLSRAQMGEDDDSLRWQRAQALYLAQQPQQAMQAAQEIIHPGFRAASMLRLYQGRSAGIQPFIDMGRAYYDQHQEERADAHHAHILLAACGIYLRENQLRQARDVLLHFDQHAVDFTPVMRDRAQIYRILLSEQDTKQQKRAITELRSGWKRAGHWDLLLRYHNLFLRL